MWRYLLFMFYRFVSQLLCHSQCAYQNNTHKQEPLQKFETNQLVVKCANIDNTWITNNKLTLFTHRFLTCWINYNSPHLKYLYVECFQPPHQPRTLSLENIIIIIRIHFILIGFIFNKPVFWKFLMNKFIRLSL